MSTFSDTSDFSDRFAGSKVVDADGKPLLVFRGEHGRPDGRRFQSRHGSISFGDLAAAKIYASSPNDHRDWVHEPRIMPAYLRISKPIMDCETDPFIDLTIIEKALGRDEAIRIAHKFADHIENTGYWYELSQKLRGQGVADLLKRHPAKLAELYFQAFNYLDDAAEVAILKRAGFDGALHCGMGENATDPEYKVFDEAQIIPASPRWLSLDEVESFIETLPAPPMELDSAPAMMGP